MQLRTKIVSSAKKVLSENTKNKILKYCPSWILYKYASIYPVDIPDIKFENNLDVLLLNLPQFCVPLMPNGLGYVHNIIKKTGVRFQTVDINVIMYHRHHKDGLPVIDMWEPYNSDKWNNQLWLSQYAPEIIEIVNKIVIANPKIVGFSVSETSREFTKRVVELVKERCSDIIILGGGYDCVYPEVAKVVYPEFDYIVIGESELTLPPLIEALVKDGLPKNMKGIISKYDTQPFIEGDRPQDLDSIEFPKYDWIDFNLYRSCWGTNVVPIISNRGCIWSKCRFCCECMPFRKRSHELVVSELKWLYEQGARYFRFNESDLLGDVETLRRMAELIQNEKLDIQFQGELRIDKRTSETMFYNLKMAGCDRLAFGVDGWSSHLLKLQNKGYRIEDVDKNLREATKYGIKTDVNMVIGVPGETEQDIDDCIENLIRMKPYISSVQNLNILLLKVGSQYYKNPEKYGIKFRDDKDVLYKKYPHLIPPELWYSEEPYIDFEVRVKRLNRIYKALVKNGIKVGQYAEWEVKRDNG
jgi:radical SAM superfamily enzyme YgiQ (UPF0313 family)